MRAYCPAARLRDHCRQLGLPFEQLEANRIAIGCPWCFRFDGRQQVILGLGLWDGGCWSGACSGCNRLAFELFDQLKLELAARRLERGEP